MFGCKLSIVLGWKHRWRHCGSVAEFFYRSFALAVACKPFVSAASCRTITSGKASFPQHVIPKSQRPSRRRSPSLLCQLPWLPATDWWPKRWAFLGGGLKRAEPSCPMN